MNQSTSELPKQTSDSAGGNIEVDEIGLANIAEDEYFEWGCCPVSEEWWLAYCEENCGST